MSSFDNEAPEIVRAALVQSKWTGNKESMIKANVALARRAADELIKKARTPDESSLMSYISLLMTTEVEKITQARFSDE